MDMLSITESIWFMSSPIEGCSPVITKEQLFDIMRKKDTESLAAKWVARNEFFKDFPCHLLENSGWINGERNITHMYALLEGYSRNCKQFFNNNPTFYMWKNPLN